MTGEHQKIKRKLSVKETSCGEAAAVSDWRGETVGGEHEAESLVTIEEVIERENLKKALQRVVSNAGSAGIDGMTVKQLPEYLKLHWLEVKEQLLAGRYKPQPVKKVEIPKPDGGVRTLGIPTVLDRFIQQALMQVMQKSWDPTFSESSYGFRPGRSAHLAVAKAQEHIQAGYSWVVDLDLEKFFDRVNHDRLMARVERRIKDRRVLKLIRDFLTAGVMCGGLITQSTEGTPQGGPLSPLLSNIVLDELDRELESRGHRFVRYADDCNIYVQSQRAGERVKQTIGDFITRKLKLKVNEAKSAVDRPWNRKILGFSFSSKEKKRRVAPKSVKRFKDKIREATSRCAGKSIEQVVALLNPYLKGWLQYFSFVEHRHVFKELDSWIRRRLRSMMWKLWGSRQYRELRARGVLQQVAWVTSKAPHGPWRLSHCPALQTALPFRFFRQLGLLTLA
jgi:RNA-directed DNA polymerase